MSKKRQYYAELELEVGASEQEIRRAYKRLAIKWHPDKNKDPGATQRFQKISNAYRKLTTEDSEEDIQLSAEDVFFSVFGPLFADIFDSGCTCPHHHYHNRYFVDSEDEYYTDDSEEGDFCYYDSDDEEIYNDFYYSGKANDPHYNRDPSGRTYYHPRRHHHHHHGEKGLGGKSSNSDSGGYGNKSSSMADKTENGEPARPEPPVLEAAVHNSLELSWTRPESFGHPILYFVLEMDRSPVPGIDFKEVYRGSKLSYKLVGLQPGSDYHFLLKAVNKKGPGGFSRVVTYRTTGSASSGKKSRKRSKKGGGSSATAPSSADLGSIQKRSAGNANSTVGSKKAHKVPEKSVSSGTAREGSDQRKGKRTKEDMTKASGGSEATSTKGSSAATKKPKSFDKGGDSSSSGSGSGGNKAKSGSTNGATNVGNKGTRGQTSQAKAAPKKKPQLSKAQRKKQARQQRQAELQRKKAEEERKYLERKKQETTEQLVAMGFDGDKAAEILSKNPTMGLHAVVERLLQAKHEESSWTEPTKASRRSKAKAEQAASQTHEPAGGGGKQATNMGSAKTATAAFSTKTQGVALDATSESKTQSNQTVSDSAAHGQGTSQNRTTGPSHYSQHTPHRQGHHHQGSGSVSAGVNPHGHAPRPLPPNKQPHVSANDGVVHVWGLPWRVTHDEIKEFFSGFQLHPDDSCNICIDVDPNGKRTGDGYVRFVDADVARKALVRHCKYMGHRYICVELSSQARMEEALTNADIALGGDVYNYRTSSSPTHAKETKSSAPHDHRGGHLPKSQAPASRGPPASKKHAPHQQPTFAAAGGLQNSNGLHRAPHSGTLPPTASSQQHKKATSGAAAAAVLTPPSAKAGPRIASAEVPSMVADPMSNSAWGGVVRPAQVPSLKESAQNAVNKVAKDHVNNTVANSNNSTMAPGGFFDSAFSQPAIFSGANGPSAGVQEGAPRVPVVAAPVAVANPGAKVGTVGVGVGVGVGPGEVESGDNKGSSGYTPFQSAGSRRLALLLDPVPGEQGGGSVLTSQPDPIAPHQSFLGNSAAPPTTNPGFGAFPAAQPHNGSNSSNDNNLTQPQQPMFYNPLGSRMPPFPQPPLQPTQQSTSSHPQTSQPPSSFFDLGGFQPTFGLGSGVNQQPDGWGSLGSGVPRQQSQPQSQRQPQPQPQPQESHRQPHSQKPTTNSQFSSPWW